MKQNTLKQSKMALNNCLLLNTYIGEHLSATMERIVDGHITLYYERVNRTRETDIFDKC